MDDNRILQQQKGIFMPDGTFKPTGEQPEKVYKTPEGQEIVNPVMVSKNDIERLQMELQKYKERIIAQDKAVTVVRDMIILLRAGIENELNIFEQREGNLTVAEIGVKERLKDIYDTVDKTLGAPEGNGTSG